MNAEYGNSILIMSTVHAKTQAVYKLAWVYAHPYVSSIL